jgi:hypothetical protein
VLTAIVAFIAVGIALAPSGQQQVVTPPAAAPASPVSAPSPSAAPSPTGVPRAVIGTAEEFTQSGVPALTITPYAPVIATGPIDMYSDGPQNGYFVSFKLVAAGLTDNTEVDSTEFYVKQGADRYDEGDGNAYEGPHAGSELSYSELNTGDVTTGWLTFDLHSPHGKLVYAPNLDGGPLQIWRF